MHSLAAWQRCLALPLGQQVFAAEQACLRQLLPTYTHGVLLQVSDPWFGEWMGELNAASRILLHHADVHAQPLSLLRGKWDAWPVQSESVNIVLLLHALEDAARPHELLQEAYRVLKPEGRLIISYFNPWNSFSWKPGQYFHKLYALKKWLQLLDFELEQKQGVFYRPLWYPAAAQQLSFLEAWGRVGVPLNPVTWVLSARKRVIPLTLVGRLLHAWKVPTFKTVPTASVRGICEGS